MINTSVFREVKTWKKPLHISHTLAAKHYLKFLQGLEIIGITGSVGKTLTQNAIASILSQKFKTIVGDENLDPTFRIPKTILSAKPWHQKLVLEYGVEHPSDMDHYLSLVKPKIVVVTTISPTHLKYFTDVEGVFAEKSKLVQALPRDGYAVLNADDQQVVKMANLTSARICWFGQKSQDGVKISHFSQSLKGSKFRLHNNGDQATVSWKVVGHHQLLAAYAAATVGLICSMTLKQIAKGLSQTKPPIHRLNSITTKDIKILDDTYNASPKAATEAIKTLVDLGKRLDKIAVLGEMKDLGTDSEKFHQELGQKISRSNINRLVTIGKIANFIGQAAEKHHFKGKIVSVPNTKEAIKTLKNIVTPKSVVLIKGSRHAHLERIVLGLLHKSTKINCYHCGTLK
ncbi:hypothetical protein A2697_01325 [Candidatus Curtissbacteria bacterium RIFCSPHIGHO2_01_FULL_41_44]|uniref:UDP-N-acetylmuramoyl-tripeptide--D-alanyl-D-alanine ligase n=1 Tax=Candidatus Curtissbacteria bacterium RIFCSPLOWO2_01_FULL_42_50 TaxID=1797730 RepID=A0A1F5H374_9BACT|nr:MAG: hypothetical protein A3C33_00540 [Candidatus Curtissbacteria bacterium RIFCSPHIGHO2_02_FULL_42_58]OGD94550.1 MAG: hypothetical protein A2697_01325 [Candidatus Curtissbacteria bacterium RIFCSPHIGHO2_01_FULL_41_44]OGD97934.1 MAG: hypothetical protein A3E71_03800 [Candidatus Curtissbacteria bacterium RIFCSPHIGHO2_12_FULL_42_33]OGD98583.1 MAG: hypothetical protein A3B54_05370 [Candidatus Curtissbacteria bacterium RIFCSPLOWO2_01_FULL_42_50]OGE02159.1 MAG: hypothetical protein A3G16_02225 [Ca